MCNIGYATHTSMGRFLSSLITYMYVSPTMYWIYGQYNDKVERYWDTMRHTTNNVIYTSEFFHKRGILQIGHQIRGTIMLNYWSFGYNIFMKKPCRGDIPELANV